MTVMNPITEAAVPAPPRILTDFILRTAIDPASRAIIDAQSFDLSPDELKPFTHNYRILYKGKAIGKTRIQLSINEGNMYLLDHSDIPEYQIYETTLSVMDAKTLRPTKFYSGGLMGGIVAAVEQGFKDSKGNGFLNFPKKTSTSKGTIAQWPEHTIDRSAAFILAPNMPLRCNEAYIFNWNCGFNEKVKEISLEVVSEETVEVPFGIFDTYKVEMIGGDPSQILYITKSSPHMVVKIETINVPWVYEMISRIAD